MIKFISLFLLILSCVSFTQQLLAQAGHPPYEWKFTCHGTKGFNAIGDLNFNASLKASYQDADFMARVDRNLGSAGCKQGSTFIDEQLQKFAGDPHTPAELRRYYTPPFIKALEGSFTDASKAYEAMGFAAPGRVRPTGKLKSFGRDANLLFLGDRKGIMAVSGCSANTAKTMAAPIQISSEAQDVWQTNKTVFDMFTLHEMGHVHQFDRWKYLLQGKCASAHNWISEGIADYVAIKATNDKTGKDYHGPYSSPYTKRFFLTRPYHVPLNLQPRGKKFGYAYESLLGYRSNGFWDYIDRRYLNKKTNKFDDLYKTFSAKDLKNQTKKVDDWIDDNDGKANQGLEHAFPMFLAEMLNWPDYRFNKKMKQNLWDTVSLGGCKKVIVGPKNSNAPVKTVSLDRYAGLCLDITLKGFKAKNIAEASLHIEALGSQKKVNELYLGWSKTAGTSNADGDCYSLLNKQGAKNSPCLLPPTQGTSKIIPGSQAGRYWTTDKLVFNGDVTVRVVLVRVPADIEDVGSKRNKKKINLTFGTSYTTMTVNGKKTNASTGVGRIPAAGGMHAPLVIKGKSVSSLMGGNGQFMQMPMLEGALQGRLGIELPDPVANDLLYGFQRLHVAQLEVGDREDSSGEKRDLFMMMEKPIEFGQTGTFEAFAMSTESGNSNILVIPNEKKPSSLTITRYDRSAIEFSGISNTCQINMAALLRIAGSSGEVDICEIGKKTSTIFEGSVAFGALAIGNNVLEEWRTPEYDAYKNLRLSRLNDKFGKMGLDQLLSGQQPSAPTTDFSDAEPEEESSSSGACDCSCDGMKKMEAMEDATDLSKMAEMMALAQCGMTCMSQYMNCE